MEGGQEIINNTGGPNQGFNNDEAYQ
jgi:hypothetical protein